MTAICPECGFEAKTAQGLSSHRLIKHNAVPKVAEKEAKLAAEAISQVVDDLYQKLEQQSEANRKAMSALEDKGAHFAHQLLDGVAEQLSKLSERDNQVAQAAAEAMAKAVVDEMSKHPVQLVDFHSFKAHKDNCPECEKLYQEELLANLPGLAEEHGYILKASEEKPEEEPEAKPEEAEEKPTKASLKDTLSAIYGEKE